MHQWAHGRDDDRVTLSAYLETMDVFTTAPPLTTLSAAEPRRLRNEFEDFYGTMRPQLIGSAEIALLLLTSWDSPVVDTHAGTRPRRKVQSGYWRRPPCPCSRCFVRTHTLGKCVRAHDVGQSPLSTRILLDLPP